jgi:hypothetical protein
MRQPSLCQHFSVSYPYVWQPIKDKGLTADTRRRTQTYCPADPAGQVHCAAGRKRVLSSTVHECLLQNEWLSLCPKGMTFNASASPRRHSSASVCVRLRLKWVYLRNDILFFCAWLYSPACSGRVLLLIPTVGILFPKPSLCLPTFYDMELIVICLTI